MVPHSFFVIRCKINTQFMHSHMHPFNVTLWDQSSTKLCDDCIYELQNIYTTPRETLRPDSHFCFLPGLGTDPLKLLQGLSTLDSTQQQTPVTCGTSSFSCGTEVYPHLLMIHFLWISLFAVLGIESRPSQAQPYDPPVSLQSLQARAVTPSSRFL